jgi:Transposase DDE domain
MERERWEKVYRLLVALDNHDFRGVFRAAVVLAVYFWAVIHDRPVRWACQLVNWPSRLPFRKLPSQPTMSRRLRQSDVLALLKRVEHHPAVYRLHTATCLKIVDAKPLPVGPCSKAPDARWGRAATALAKGYKLFAIWGRGPLPITWRVDSMNVSEENMAAEMLLELKGSGGYVLGDKLYDSNRLYDIAASNGHQLVAARKKIGKGLGHHYHSPARLRSIELLKGSFGRELYALRRQIEHNFGNLTNFGGGLSPLPSWVRRLPRVRLWVTAKLIVSALHRHPPSPTAVEYS